MRGGCAKKSGGWGRSLVAQDVYGFLSGGLDCGIDRREKSDDQGTDRNNGDFDRSDLDGKSRDEVDLGIKADMKALGKLTKKQPEKNTCKSPKRADVQTIRHKDLHDILAACAHRSKDGDIFGFFEHHQDQRPCDVEGSDKDNKEQDDTERELVLLDGFEQVAIHIAPVLEPIRPSPQLLQDPRFHGGDLLEIMQQDLQAADRVIEVKEALGLRKLDYALFAVVLMEAKTKEIRDAKVSMARALFVAKSKKADRRDHTDDITFADLELVSETFAESDTGKFGRMG